MEIQTAKALFKEIESAAEELNDRILRAAEQGLKITATLHFESPGEGFYECHQLSVYDPVINIEHEPPEYWRDATEDMEAEEAA